MKRQDIEIISNLLGIDPKTIASFDQKFQKLMNDIEKSPDEPPVSSRPRTGNPFFDGMKQTESARETSKKPNKDMLSLVDKDGEVVGMVSKDFIIDHLIKKKG